ncbi:MAG: alpha/beta hydrolase [Lachnospiraceae bacterium]|nr:alpha/beta hydrolase [Lachnospiraceae bacterium]
MEEFYIDDDGIKLHAKLNKPEGKKKCPLVIVVHGYTGHMEEQHLLCACDAIHEAGMGTLRVEMFGHGQSDGTFREHTIYKWISNLLKVVEYTEKLDWVTDLYLCGHSQGGLLVMLVAGMCPGKFKAIIPLSPAWMIPEWAREGIFFGLKIDALNVPDVIDADPEHIISGNYVRAAQTIHVEDEIARFEKPVLIVHGEKDLTVPLEYGEKACKLYKNAKLVVVPGDDHCFNMNVGCMSRAVREFLTELY